MYLSNEETVDVVCAYVEGLSDPELSTEDAREAIDATALADRLDHNPVFVTESGPVAVDALVRTSE